MEQKIKHAISIDLEYWFLGFSSRNIKGWEKYESNDEMILRKILEFLETRGVKATFFVLGKFAEEFPHLVSEIDRAGHEIASHGFSHKPIPSFSKDEFRKDLRASIEILQKITRKKVIGHRAMGWSLKKENLWALEILLDEGIQYDSSIAPTFFHKYGYNESKTCPHIIEFNHGKSIYEFPMQTVSIFKFRLPIGGGFYLRALPFYLTQLGLKQSEKNLCSGMIYFHPYDMDINTPLIKTNFAFKFIRYHNLDKTEDYLNRLLKQFQFCSVGEIYKQLLLIS